jgi:hypothetical protein
LFFFGDGGGEGGRGEGGMEYTQSNTQVP